MKHLIFDHKNWGSVLFILGKSENDKTFNACFDLFEEEWKNLKPVLSRSNSRSRSNIIGIVAGKKSEYRRTFKGDFKVKEFELSVKFDGKVSMEPANGKADFSIKTFIYWDILMPGQIIVTEIIKDNIGPQDLLQFKDGHGNSPDYYLKLEAKSFEEIRSGKK